MGSNDWVINKYAPSLESYNQYDVEKVIINIIQWIEDNPDMDISFKTIVHKAKNLYVNEHNKTWLQVLTGSTKAIMFFQTYLQ